MIKTNKDIIKIVNIISYYVIIPSIKKYTVVNVASHNEVSRYDTIDK